MSTRVAAAVTFTTANDVDLVESQPQDIAVGDFNADGHLDLAVTSKGDHDPGVTVYIGDGAGNFDDQSLLQPPLTPWGIATEDFDGDGVLDLVVTSSGHEATAVNLYRGVGDGSFVLEDTIHAGKFPVSVVAADFNEDDRIDLAVANNVLYGLTIFIGYGDGSFAAGAHVPEAISLPATDLEAGDLNGDDHIDLVVSHYYGVSTFYGAGDGSFSTDVPAKGGNVITEAVALGDIDGDGNVDIAAIEIYNQILTVNLGVDGVYATGSLPKDLVLTDFNRDKSLDAAVVNGDGSNVSLYINDGVGGFEDGGLLVTGFQPQAIEAGDWNEDGNRDLAIAVRNLGETAYTTFAFQDDSGQLDIEPPTASITSPENGALVHGIVPIRANASDDAGVVRVAFFVDGAPIGVSARPFIVGWDTDAATPGAHILTAVAYDAAGNASASAAVPVSLDNAYPKITSIPPVGNPEVGQEWVYHVTAVGEPAPTFSLSGAPTGVAIEPTTGTITWTPAPGQLGEQSFTVTATNASGTDNQALTLTVVDTIAPETPVGLAADSVTTDSVSIVWSPSTDNVGVAFYRLYEHRRINQFVSVWDLIEDNLVAPTAAITGLAPGSYLKLAVSAVDEAGNESLKSEILALRTYIAPSIYLSGGALTDAFVADEAALFTLDYDSSGEPAPEFSLSGAPEGMSIDPVTGVLEWNPAPGQLGQHSISAIATNAVGSATYPFTVTVVDASAPTTPTGLVLDAVTAESASLRWTEASDNLAVAFYRIYRYVPADAVSGEWVLALDGVTMPNATVAGLAPGSETTFAVTAVDAAGNESPRSESLLVQALVPPLIYLNGSTDTAFEIAVGAPFLLDFDAYGDPAPAFELLEGPAAVQLDPNTGILSWTATDADAGVHTIIVRASSEVGSSDYTITVTVVDAAADFDVDGDGVCNAVDIQAEINAALGLGSGAGHLDWNGDGFVNAVDVQLVILAALGVNVQ